MKPLPEHPAPSGDDGPRVSPHTSRTSISASPDAPGQSAGKCWMRMRAKGTLAALRVPRGGEGGEGKVGGPPISQVGVGQCHVQVGIQAGEELVARIPPDEPEPELPVDTDLG